MKRHTYRILAATAATTAIAGMLATPTAWGQEAEPLAVTAAQACGRVTLTATVGQNFGDNDTYEIGVFSGPNAGDADTKLEGQFRVSADPGSATQTFTLDEDSYDGSGFVRWVTLSGPNPEFYVSGVVGVETDCAPPAEPEPEPSDDPEPTTPDDQDPSEEPDPAPGDTPDPGTTPPSADQGTEPPADDPANDDTGVYFETCADARAAGAAPLYVTEPGYRAELDSDTDGEACETDLLNPIDAPGFSQTGQVPVGAAETGQA